VRNGRLITRPPGLSDTPGGAAIAGGLTAILGLGLILQTRKTSHSLVIVVMSAIGLAAVYMTQARSVLLMCVGAAAVMVAVAFKQGRVARASWGLTAAGAAIVASFLWASAVGGTAIDSRFLDITQTGAIATYQQSRGDFLSETLGDLLDKYPLGAGLGRWGMMEAYFGDPSTPGASHIHVEIQLTGWLLDGGIPMWILYGGAIIVSVAGVLAVAFGRSRRASELAPNILAVQLFVVGSAWRVRRSTRSSASCSGR